jgi:hypothetical protein
MQLGLITDVRNATRPLQSSVVCRIHDVFQYTDKCCLVVMYLWMFYTWPYGEFNWTQYVNESRVVSNWKSVCINYVLLSLTAYVFLIMYIVCWRVKLGILYMLWLFQLVVYCYVCNGNYEINYGFSVTHLSCFC